MAWDLPKRADRSADSGSLGRIGARVTHIGEEVLAAVEMVTNSMSWRDFVTAR